MTEVEPDFAGELTRALRARDRSTNVAYVRPRLAASLVLVDASGSETRVLLGERRHDQRFMPGAYVFPGGRVERGDWRGGDGLLHEASLGKLAASGVAGRRASAFAAAALRETLEETGVRVNGELHFVARAVTPPDLPIRFDTCFFACDARHAGPPAEDCAGPAGEFVNLVWASAREASTLPLPLITSVVLRDVLRRAAAGLPAYWPTPVYRARRAAWSRVAL